MQHYDIKCLNFRQQNIAPKNEARSPSMAYPALQIVQEASPRIDAKSILDALPDIVLVVNGDDQIQAVNTAAEAFLGTGATQIEGRPATAFLPPDSPIFDLLAQCRRNGQSISDSDFSIELPKQGPRRFALFMTCLENESGVVIHLKRSTTAEDMGRQLRSRESARSVQTMSAMIAHEIKNPLAGIRGAAQLLEQTASEDDKELARLIRDESDRIRELVERMDMFAPGHLPQVEPVNIHSVLDHVRKSAEAGFACHVTFEQDYDPSLPEVAGNHNQLVQLFMNLVKNAAEAVDAEQGHIILTTSYQPGLRVTADGVRRRLPLLVTVEDNGCGIPAELQASLFDPFVSGKTHGSGLGLAIAAKIADDHGGLIDMQSQPGRTVFEVSLPLWGS